MLTDAQIEYVKAEGYVILRDFYESAQTDAWPDLYWPGGSGRGPMRELGRFYEMLAGAR